MPDPSPMRHRAQMRTAIEPLVDSFRSATAFAVFLLLATINAIRTLRHEMWHDELQAFMLAAGSPTLVDLFHNLKYEGHPGLWHALLWIVTRFTTDPIAMQVLHLAIALVIWILIFTISPFTIGEKVLLVLSYFLFWEYFVISRNYVLIPLIVFPFVALWERRPQPELVDRAKCPTARDRGHLEDRGYLEDK